MRIGAALGKDNLLCNTRKFLVHLTRGPYSGWVGRRLQRKTDLSALSKS
jgi:hypothetical protein